MPEISFKYGRYVSHLDLQKWKFYISGKKLKYMTRNDAALKYYNPCDLNKESNYVTQLRKSLTKRHITGHAKNSGLLKFDFQNKNFVESISVNNEIKNLKKIKNDQFIWDGIISISEKDANRLRFGSQKSFSEIIKRFVPSFLKAEGFDPANVNFLASVHVNTNNPHVHWMFYEKEANVYDSKMKMFSFRKKGKLSLNNAKKFSSLASSWANSSFEYREAKFQAKKDFWTTRDKLKNEIKDYQFRSFNSDMFEVLDEIKNKKINVFKNLSDNSKEKVWKFFETEISKNLPNANMELKKYISFIQSNSSDPSFEKDFNIFKTSVGQRVLKDLKISSKLIEFKHSLTSSPSDLNNFETKKNEIVISNKKKQVDKKLEYLRKKKKREYEYLIQQEIIKANREAMKRYYKMQKQK